jgi:8-oxo-dGTP diphosphatase
MYYGTEHPHPEASTSVCTGCFLEHGGKILLLRRTSEKSWGGCWGLPGGKAESGELPHETMTRELWEETGIVHPVSPADAATVVYVSFEPNQLIAFHLFHVVLAYAPREIQLRHAEHSQWQWCDPDTAITLPDLFPHTAECIAQVYHLEHHD